MNRKITALFLIFAMMSALITGCGQKSLDKSGLTTSVSSTVGAGENGVSGDASQQQSQNLNANDNGMQSIQDLITMDTIEISLPESVADAINDSSEDAAAMAKAAGYENVTVHEDGSVTYTVTGPEAASAVAGYEAMVDETIADYTQGEHKVASYESIEHNDDLTEFKIYVNSSYEGWEDIYVLDLYDAAFYSQLMRGRNPDAIDAAVYVIDKKTNSVLNQSTFREDMGL